MSERVEALKVSVQHLNDVVIGIDAADYTLRAYPSEWTIADTLSHLGSGAVIGQRRVEDVLAGREGDPSFNSSVWDEWNAKEPAAQVADCLISDASLLECLESTSPAKREAFHFSMGPFSFDFEGMVGLRLSEHVLHTWDVEVIERPGTTLDNGAANVILDDIGFMVAHAATYTGEKRELIISTLDPVRSFTLTLSSDGVSLVEKATSAPVDLVLPAESLVRLVYGRLDESSTPSSVSGDVIDELRSVFHGI